MLFWFCPHWASRSRLKFLVIFIISLAIHYPVLVGSDLALVLDEQLRRQLRYNAQVFVGLYRSFLHPCLSPLAIGHLLVLCLMGLESRCITWYLSLHNRAASVLLMRLTSDAPVFVLALVILILDSKAWFSAADICPQSLHIVRSRVGLDYVGHLVCAGLAFSTH